MIRKLKQNQSNRRKEIIYQSIKYNTNYQKKKKTSKRICSLKGLSKLDECFLKRQHKNYENKRIIFSTKATDNFKRIIRKYCEQFYANNKHNNGQKP